MTETATAESVLLLLERSQHDATKRELASVRARLNAKPKVTQVNSTRWLEIGHAETREDNVIIGMNIATGEVCVCSWTRGYLERDIADSDEPEMIWGWWVEHSLWNPTHFIPFPQMPAEAFDGSA